MITFRALGQRGRLGNQLFQIAATIGIARDRGVEPIFPANWLYRPYFSLPDTFFGELPLDISEATEFAPHLDPRCRDYLQDISLFIHHLGEIREYFSPSDLAWRMMKEVPRPAMYHPRLVVHVRRGDNVVDPGVANKADYHPVPPTDYYLRGMKHFDKYDRMWILSDDVPWCKENLPKAELYGHGVAYVKEHEPTYGTYAPDDWKDLFLMTRGQAFVVTGSTFGIWGALLADVPTDNVVRPNKVYGPALPWINDSALFHPEWEILECF